MRGPYIEHRIELVTNRADIRPLSKEGGGKSVSLQEQIQGGYAGGLAGFGRAAELQDNWTPGAGPLLNCEDLRRKRFKFIDLRSCRVFSHESETPCVQEW